MGADAPTLPGPGGAGLLCPDLHNHGKAPDACDPHFFIGKRGVKINAKGVCVYN